MTTPHTAQAATAPSGRRQRRTNGSATGSKFVTLLFGHGTVKHSTDGTSVFDGSGKRTGWLPTESEWRAAQLHSLQTMGPISALNGGPPIPDDLKGIFASRERFPHCRRESGSLRTSGNNWKNHGKVRDVQIDFEKFAPRMSPSRTKNDKHGQRRPPALFAARQVSQLVYVGGGVPSVRSCKIQNMQSNAKNGDLASVRYGKVGNWNRQNGSTRTFNSERAIASTLRKFKGTADGPVPRVDQVHKTHVRLYEKRLSSVQTFSSDSRMSARNSAPAAHRHHPQGSRSRSRNKSSPLPPWRQPPPPWRTTQRR